MGLLIPALKKLIGLLKLGVGSRKLIKAKLFLTSVPRAC